MVNKTKVEPIDPYTALAIATYKNTQVYNYTLNLCFDTSLNCFLTF
ncbi:hypothetical protein GAMM_200023 [Gammaproteobacteria bacterium]